MRRLSALACSGLFVFAASCAGGASERTYRAEVPPELRTSFELFTHRCSKCHSLSRPLDSGIDDDEHWAMYVERMRLQPGSGISRKDAETILEFLRYYAQRERERRGRRGRAPDAAAPSPPADPPARPAEPDAGHADASAAESATP